MAGVDIRITERALLSHDVRRPGWQGVLRGAGAGDRISEHDGEGQLDRGTFTDLLLPGLRIGSHVRAGENPRGWGWQYTDQERRGNRSAGRRHLERRRRY